VVYSFSQSDAAGLRARGAGGGAWSGSRAAVPIRTGRGPPELTGW